MSKGRKHLEDLLVEAGLLSDGQLDKALTIQKETGARLDKILLDLGYVTEDNIMASLELQLGIPRIDLGTMIPGRETAAIIPAALARRHQIVPVSLEERKLTLAMADPTNFYAIDDVRMITGYEVHPVLAAERDIRRAISQCYGVQDLVNKAVHKLRIEELPAIPEMQIEDDAPMIGLVNSLFSQAVRERASDIHIEPQSATLRIRFRIDGMLKEIASFTRDLHAALVSRIKIMADMDIAERRLPQDGRIKIQEMGREIDVRVSSLPTIYGEKVVMRILDRKAVILDLQKLGFTADNLYRYQQLYTRSHGLILVTGPVGSGKTTTLNSTLSALNSEAKNIITVEDPVEYSLAGLNQVQVNPKAGLTFASGLRSILRQDPNIVMVGEIRDMETGDIAVRAALTGHLVLSTLHTNDAPGAVARLIDMGIEPFMVAASVLGVVAQRLVRVICQECKDRYIPASDSEERLFLEVDPFHPVTLYRGTGCPSCGYSGYKGRMAIQEVMPVSSRIRDLINKRSFGAKLVAAAREEGMLSMREDGIRKALDGSTTVAEVMRVAYTGV